MPPAPDCSEAPADGTPQVHRELATRLEGMNLYLVGMMGAGKSAVGRPLAASLGYRFIDADVILEQSCGRTIPQIFAQEGEDAFRAVESSVLDQIAQWHSLVVATGGGVVTRPRNWGTLRQGLVVWLDAPEEVLLRRLAADPTPRPLLEDADAASRVRRLLRQRRPLYAQADLTVAQREGDSPELVAMGILDAIPGILKKRPEPPQAGRNDRSAE